MPRSGGHGRAITATRKENRSYSEIFRHALKEIVDFFVFFVTDAARALIIFLVIYIASMVLQLGKLAGVSEDDLYLLDRLHFWFNYAAYGISGIWFLLRLVRWMWREFRES